MNGAALFPAPVEPRPQPLRLNRDQLTHAELLRLRRAARAGGLPAAA